MKILTADDYRKSLGKLKPQIFAQGEKISQPAEHSLFKPHFNCAAMTYELASIPEYQDLFLADSHLSGERINRFTHIHQSREDLVKKVKMFRLVGQKTAACFQRCVGFDGLNAVYSVSYEIDQKYGTDYHWTPRGSS